MNSEVWTSERSVLREVVTTKGTKRDTKDPKRHKRNKTLGQSFQKSEFLLRPVYH